MANGLNFKYNWQAWSMLGAMFAGVACAISLIVTHLQLAAFDSFVALMGTSFVSGLFQNVGIVLPALYLQMATTFLIVLIGGLIVDVTAITGFLFTKPFEKLFIAWMSASLMFKYLGAGLTLQEVVYSLVVGLLLIAVVDAVARHTKVGVPV